jgi:hypothetical protein
MQWKVEQRVNQSKEALDRLEALLMSWGCSTTRTRFGLNLPSDIGVTAIAASAIDPSQSPFGAPCMVVRATTSLFPHTVPYFARLAPLLNRFAMFGAITQDGDDVSIISRITLAEDSEQGDDTLILIGAAALWNVTTMIDVADHINRRDPTPSTDAPSAWGKHDLAAVANRFRDHHQFVVRVEEDSLSVAFQSAGYRVLIEVFLSTPHPTLGAGLLIGLEIISDDMSPGSPDALVTRLNYDEALPRPNVDHLGAWCLGRSDNSIGYVSFIPNMFKDAVTQPSIEQRFVFNAVNRGVLTTQQL